MDMKNFMKEYDKVLESYIKNIKKEIVFWKVHSNNQINQEVFNLRCEYCRNAMKKYNKSFNEVLFHLEYCSDWYKTYKLTEAIEKGHDAKMEYIRLLNLLKYSNN